MRNCWASCWRWVRWRREGVGDHIFGGSGVGVFGGEEGVVGWGGGGDDDCVSRRKGGFRLFDG